MNKEYYRALKHVWEYGIETSPRGMKVKEVLGYTLELYNPIERVVTLKPMQTSTKYGLAELEWYLKNTNKISDLKGESYQKIWKRFSDDGKTVNSSYGYRIFGGHPLVMNQWKWVLDKLKEDKDTRQAIINLNSYFDKEKPTKDFICCVSVQFFIRNENLHCIVTFRSSDIFLGWRNDIFVFTIMQELLANHLVLGIGTFKIFSASLHLYEKDFKKAEQILYNYNIDDIKNIKYDDFGIDHYRQLMEKQL